MTASMSELISADEITASIANIAALTGHKILKGWSMGNDGVEINHDEREITINGYLDPVAFRWALVRAYRRIVEGAGGAPEFHAQLRLVR